MLRSFRVRSALAAITALSISALALADSARRIDVPAGDLASALELLAKQAGVEFMYSSAQVRGVYTAGAKGELTAEQAVEELLRGTKLKLAVHESGALLITLPGTPTAGSVSEPDVSRRLAQAPGADAAGQALTKEADRPTQSGSVAESPASAVSPGERLAEDAALDEVMVLGSRSRFRVRYSAAATKIEMPLKDTPQAITIISDELMRTVAIRNTADAADFVPGLQESGTVNGTEISLVSRGFDVNRDRGYKINGLVTNAELDLDYAALERLEVVRGPASVIYGEVDYGATLNRVLKRPTPSFQAIAAVESGSFDSRRGELDVGGPLTRTGTLGARVVAAYQDADTQIDFTNTHEVLVAPSLVWRPNDTASLALQAYYQTIKGNYSDGFGSLPDFSLPNVSRHAYLGADYNRIDTRNRFVTLNYDQVLPAGFKLAVKGAYSRVELDNLTSFLQGVDVDGDASVFGFPEPKDKRDRSFDVTLSKPFKLGGQEHTIAISVDRRKQRNVDTGSDFLEVGTVNVFDPRPIATTPDFRASLYNPDYLYITELELSGVSLLALLQPTERLHFVAGLRYTESKNSELFGTDFTTAQASDTIGRLGVVYKLTADWSGYASWSAGIIFNAGMKDAERRNIKPERGEQVEVGVKADLFDDRASFAAALFRIERTNSATFVGLQPDPPFDSIFENIGRQDHQGVEVELLGEIVPGLDVLASYQYLDIDVKEAEDPATIGQRPPDAPRQSFSLFVNHALRLPALRGLAVGAGVVSRSEREADAIGTLQLPSFTRFDVRASYDITDHLFAEFGVKNIGNKRILVSTYDAADHGLFYVDPRSYSLRLTYRF